MKEISADDIKLESTLLHFLSKKENYDRFIKTIDTKRLIPITNKLLIDYKKYYDKYATDINWGVFYTDFSQNWHNKDLDESDLAYYRETVFPLITNSIITDDVQMALLERESKRKIEKAIESGAPAHELLAIITELVSEQKKNSPGQEEIFTLGNVDVSVLDTKNGLTWFLPSLQAGLNSHMPGQFVVIAADSDTGKSAFCISQAVHVFKQLNKNKSKRPILYCTSEDTKEDLVCRFLACLYKEKIPGGFEEIIEHYDHVRNNYVKNFDDSLFMGIAIRNANDLYKIHEKIATYNPALIIIDMLDILSASDHITDLTKLYQNIRGLANDGYQIIGTSQTGNTSYQDNETKQYKHRKWLSDKDLSGSKSGKQGAAYCMIMIGKDDDMPNIRYLTTTKKKRGKHVSTTCELIDVYSCYKELL